MVSERAVRIRWGVIGVRAFLLLMGVEVATESEPARRRPTRKEYAQ
jgi:hypothetical protein